MDEEDDSEQINTQDPKENLADLHVLEESTFPNGFKCATCFDWTENNPGVRWVGCSRCHHATQSHGIQVNEGKRVERFRHKHLCPTLNNQPFKCSGFFECPTGLKSKHQEELKIAKEDFKKQTKFPSLSQAFLKLPTDEQRNKLQEELKEAQKKIQQKNHEDNYMRNRMKFEFDLTKDEKITKNQPSVSDEKKESVQLTTVSVPGAEQCANFYEMSKDELKIELDKVIEEERKIKRKKITIEFLYNLNETI